MGTRLYVGNLSFSSTNETVREAFARIGEVTDVHIVTDRTSGQSRGFGFVTMGTPAEAQKAIEAMNGSTLDGRPLRVNEAEERPSAAASVAAAPVVAVVVVVAAAVAAVAAAVVVAAAETGATVGKLIFLRRAHDPHVGPSLGARGLVPKTRDNGVLAAKPQGDAYARGG